MLRKAGDGARGGGAGARRARASRSSRPSASWSRSCSPSRPRCAEAADRRAPHRIAAYALELAQAFTAFYRDCRVVGAEPRTLESFRLAL